MGRRVSDFPSQLAQETTDLLATLDETVANLREFTEKLRAATAASRQEGEATT